MSEERRAGEGASLRDATADAYDHMKMLWGGVEELFIQSHADSKARRAWVPAVAQFWTAIEVYAATCAVARWKRKARDVEPMMAVLTVSRCATHGVYAITVEKGGHGHRLTSGTCCGSWGTVHGWPITSAELREVADWLESPDFPRAGAGGSETDEDDDGDFTVCVECMEDKPLDPDNRCANCAAGSETDEGEVEPRSMRDRDLFGGETDEGTASTEGTETAGREAE